ncbi:hypothetical protein, partial [Xanthomonas euvesicatoria]
KGGFFFFGVRPLHRRAASLLIRLVLNLPSCRSERTRRKGGGRYAAIKTGRAEAGTGRPCGLRAPPTIELASQIKAPASDDGRLRAPATFIGLIVPITDFAMMG